MADNNPFPGENNTGHIWDDNIRELSNPPPKWWMISLWASLAWFGWQGLKHQVSLPAATTLDIEWNNVEELVISNE